jgi:L-alanine-DL-glutamate epimerase-like enolase superfamily enzyme
VSCPIWEWQEHLPQTDDRRSADVVDAVVPLADGLLMPREAPGLGIALDDEGLAKHPPRQPPVAPSESGRVWSR